MIRKLLDEPLVAFLLLGAVLFAVYAIMNPDGSRVPQAIVVTQPQIDSLAVGFTRTWRRPPSQQELEGLIRDRVREEVYYREAVALGLDKDDAVVRRRLQQKVEFLTQDVAALAEPTDAQLRSYLDAHADAFRTDTHVTFRHVYLDPARRGDALARDAAKLVARLSRTGNEADGATVGDPFLLDHAFAAVPLGDVARQFGAAFAAKLREAPTGRWIGPFASGFGQHLVFVRERVEGRPPALADVRDAVRREWTNAQRLETNERFYRTLLARYVVTIERADGAAAGVAPVAASER